MVYALCRYIPQHCCGLIYDATLSSWISAISSLVFILTFSIATVLIIFSTTAHHQFCCSIWVNKYAHNAVTSPLFTLCINVHYSFFTLANSSCCNQIWLLYVMGATGVTVLTQIVLLNLMEHPCWTGKQLPWKRTLKQAPDVHSPILTLWWGIIMILRWRLLFSVITFTPILVTDYCSKHGLLSNLGFWGWLLSKVTSFEVSLQ